jgi:hypothetical protein
MKWPGVQEEVPGVGGVGETAGGEEELCARDPEEAKERAARSKELTGCSESGCSIALLNNSKHKVL